MKIKPNFKIFFLVNLAVIQFARSQQNDDPASLQLATWDASHPDGEIATDTGGIPYPSLTASLSIGKNGPGLLDDRFLLERITAFNRERPPERSVHTKGTAAHGILTITNDISKWTKAKFVNKINKQTPVFMRISDTAGESGFPDTILDAHGFAIKFYTEEGNFDIAGNRIDVFNVRDAMQFVDINRSKKRNPQTNLRDSTMAWDMVSRRPEATQHTLKLFSDSSYPESLRMINGSGIHTYKIVNALGKPFYCKFHFISQQAFEMMPSARATYLAGSEPNYYQKEFYNAITSGNHPKWLFAVQIATIDEAEKYRWDSFDSTKNWRPEDFPLIPVGMIELNAWPENYFATTEQAIFSVGALVPGIETSPDRLFHARTFSYSDAQRYRVGINRNLVPVNQPLNKVSTYERDGQTCTGSNGGGAPNYHPNSFNGPKVDPYASLSPFFLSGDVGRVDTKDNDNYSQAAVYLEKDVTPEEKQRIANGIGASLATVVSQDVVNHVFENNLRPLGGNFASLVQAAINSAKANPAATIAERA